MKFQVELAYLLLLVVVLFVRPSFVATMKNSVLGRLLLVVGIVHLSLKNKMYGVLAALVTICLFQNVREGFTHEGDKGEDDTEESEKEDEEEPAEEEGEEKEPAEDETEGTDETDETEGTEGTDETEGTEGTESEEAFTLMGGSGFNTSSHDRLAAEQMLRPKAANSLPIANYQSRGQTQSVTSSVLNSIQKLFA